MVDFSFEHCVVHTATFTQAQFHGRTSFVLSTFTGPASFNRARFGVDGACFFSQLSFKHVAEFRKAVFHSTQFSRVGFTFADFDAAKFDDQSAFADTQFARAKFENAQMHPRTSFSNVKFGFSVPDELKRFAPDVDLLEDDWLIEDDTGPG